jgi:hypothetical protein
MTAPLPVGPAPDQLAIELAAAARATNGLRRQLEQAARQITALYIRLAGSLTNPLPPLARAQFADAAARIIAAVQVDIRDDLWDMVLRALRIGQATAMQYVYDATRRAAAEAHTQAQTLSDHAYPAALWIYATASTIQDRTNATLLSAQSIPTIGLPASNYQEVQNWLAFAHRAVSQVERDVRWATNAAYNQGVREIADAAEMDRMWIAERDACLHCLAYSGEVAQTGRPYPTGLTYYIDPQGNPKPLKPYPAGFVWGPPLHPNCRCDQRPYAGVSLEYPIYPWESGLTTPSQALKREAKRAVLRGDSGSDSVPASLRAVSALLASGATGLPVTVERRARRAVRTGVFTRR